MSVEIIERFPLFPLPLVVLPGEVVPLHIFEERYKLMIGRCLETDREFGIVWLGDDGLHDVGCTTRVTRVLERMADGRMNILARGGRPFRLLRRIDALEYPAGDVELLDDASVEADEEGAAEARAAYADLVERVTDKRPDDGELAAIGSYGMAARIDFGLERKQALLELRSEPERLGELARILSAALDSIDRAGALSERARSNGKVHLEGLQPG